jgi:two-component system response regulator AlgR
MTLKVLLVDDEPLARARMKTLLADCTQPCAAVAAEAADGAQALALMRTQCFDVALLDIHMPGLSGMALANALRTFADPPAIVFDMDVADYLTKPVRLERLQKALHKAASQRGQGSVDAASALAMPRAEADVLLVQERNRVLRLSVDEIVYVRSELKYLTVRTATRSHLLDGALSDLEQRWGERFVRTHRSVLAARHAMRALERVRDADGEGWVLQLAGVDERVPVSRRQLPLVRQAMGKP